MTVEIPAKVRQYTYLALAILNALIVAALDVDLGNQQWLAFGAKAVAGTTTIVLGVAAAKTTRNPDTPDVAGDDLAGEAYDQPTPDTTPEPDATPLDDSGAADGLTDTPA